MQNVNYEIEEMLPIVIKLAEQYTGNQSTSITYEKAQQFMEAVIYCIHEYEGSGINTLTIQRISAEKAYSRGFQILIEKVKEMKEIYHSLIKNFQSYGNSCLKDTVQKGIPEFLKWYDIRYCPQDTILTLDYPIMEDLSGYSGIDAIYEYMKNIYLEQEFLSKFDSEYVENILAAYSLEYEDIIENICSIIILNTIGHILLQKPLHEMGLKEEEYEKIGETFAGISEIEIENMVYLLLKKIIEQHYEKQEQLLRYICKDVKNIAVRIKNAVQFHHLNQLFLV